MKSRGTLQESHAPKCTCSHCGNEAHPADLLTEQQMRVFLMVANGMRNYEIQKELALQNKNDVTVFKNRIFKRTGLKNQYEIVRYAVAKRIVK